MVEAVDLQDVFCIVRFLFCSPRAAGALLKGKGLG